MQIPWTTFILVFFYRLKDMNNITNETRQQQMWIHVESSWVSGWWSVLFSLVSTKLKKLIRMCLLGSMKQWGDTSGILLLPLNTVSQDSTLQPYSMRLVLNPRILSIDRQHCSHKDFKWTIALMFTRVSILLGHQGVFLGWNVNGETRAAWIFWWECEY